MKCSCSHVCLSVRLSRDLTEFSFCRPFKCSKCGKSFTREATYSSHECRVQKRQARVFNGFKTCPVCGIRVRPNALSTHERKHARALLRECAKNVDVITVAQLPSMLIKNGALVKCPLPVGKQRPKSETFLSIWILCIPIWI